MGCCISQNNTIEPNQKNQPVQRFVEFLNPEPHGVRTKNFGVSSEIFQKENVQFSSKSKGSIDLALGALSKHILFNHLKEAQLLRCIQAMTEVKCSKGSDIIEQGSNSQPEGKDSEMYIVENGSFDVYIQRLTANGETKRIRVAHLSRGATFGEMSLLYAKERTATVTASEDSKCLALSRFAYRNILLNAASLYQMSMQKFLQSVDCFQFLSGQQKAEILDEMEMVEFEENDVIFKEHDRDTFYIIKAGKVSIQQDSKEHIVLGVGSWFGRGLEEDNEKVAMVCESLGNAPVVNKTTNSEAQETDFIEKSSFRIMNEHNSAVANGPTIVMKMHFQRFASLLKPLYSSSLEVFDVVMKHLLQSLELFESMDDRQLSQIYSKTNRRFFDEGELICRQGEIGDSFFVIARGEVLVRRHNKGRIHNVVELRSGEFFGERGVVTEDPRSADCVALTDVLCLELDRESFLQFAPDSIAILKRRKYISDLSTQRLKLQDLEQRQTVGVGGFGRVKVAVHRSTNKPYALKYMEKAKIIQLGQRQHILDERIVMAELDHPFITKLHATFQTKRYLFMVLDLNVGGEMFTLLRNVDVLDEPTAKFYAACLVLSLNFLHKRHIVYRDLKPENTLFDERGYIKLVDFGFAKRLVSRTFTVCGTPELV
eukprot:TRINITY_DN383_c2_g2_i3.p1 TRINITY_DN383_c2_g2~~TRINITY_DN383_c2_g2_i3.p1  ORF type:complete len:655 (+),score=121.90 TRINITY_DN383_c2_g2_i3:1411-3375(+)